MSAVATTSLNYATLIDQHGCAHTAATPSARQPAPTPLPLPPNLGTVTSRPFIQTPLCLDSYSNCTLFVCANFISTSTCMERPVRRQYLIGHPNGEPHNQEMPPRLSSPPPSPAVPVIPMVPAETHLYLRPRHSGVAQQYGGERQK